MEVCSSIIGRTLTGQHVLVYELSKNYEVSMLRFYFTGAPVRGGMRWFMRTQILKTILAGGFLIVTGFLLWASRSSAQTASGQGATISGTVTANSDYALSEASGKHIPALYAVRVRA